MSVLHGCEVISPPDIGMFRLYGFGVAMGNAVPAVKAAADVLIGKNDEDEIAEWLEATFL